MVKAHNKQRQKGRAKARLCFERYVTRFLMSNNKIIGVKLCAKIVMHHVGVQVVNT